MTLTREKFNELIHRDDDVGMHAVGRALVHLFNRQTADEKVTNDTKVDNGRGFTSGDARSGSISAKFYLKHHRLDDWQLKAWRKPSRKGGSRLGKYFRQIAEEAAKKEGPK